MEMNKVKNVLIIVLAFAAIIQTNILWLEKISRHDFFYGIKNCEKKVLHSLAENFRMITKVGDNFSIIYKPNEDEKKITDFVITKVLDEGKFVESREFNFEDELSQAVCVYDYSFQISAENFSYCYAKKSGNISRVKMFDKIFFYDNGKVAFANTIENKFYQYRLKDNYSFENLPVSSNLYDKNFMRQNISELEIINPYAENGEILMDTIAKKLDIFFNNSATKNSENINNIFTFYNESALVKYFPSNILEYTNYDTGNKNSDLLSDYLTAINFISKDVLITNDYILKNYEENEDESKFYFDYFVDNVPIEIKNDFTNFICVTVRNNSVGKYKKFVFNFRPTQNNLSGYFSNYIFYGNSLS